MDNQVAPWAWPDETTRNRISTPNRGFAEGWGDGRRAVDEVSQASRGPADFARKNGWHCSEEPITNLVPSVFLSGGGVRRDPKLMLTGRQGRWRRHVVQFRVACKPLSPLHRPPRLVSDLETMKQGEDKTKGCERRNSTPEPRRPHSGGPSRLGGRHTCCFSVLSIQETCRRPDSTCECW